MTENQALALIAERAKAILADETIRAHIMSNLDGFPTPEILKEWATAMAIATLFGQTTQRRTAMKTICVTLMGEDSWNRPVFKGDNGRLYKSIELFSLDTPPDLTELYDCDNDFEGEPGYPPKDTTFELVGQHPWLQ